MNCPECGSQIYVKYMRYLKDGTTARTRICPNCGNRVRTIEVNKSKYRAMNRLSQDLRWAVDRFLQGRKTL